MPSTQKNRINSIRSSGRKFEW